MLLHPVVSEVASRRDRLAESILKGHLAPEVGRYLSPGWAYVYKDRDVPNLAFARAGNYDGTGDDGEAVLYYVITTDDEDRDGDVVRPMGGHLKNYSRNPLVFFGHQEWEIPIGVCRSSDGRILVFPEENRTRAGVNFDLPDPDAAFIHDKCKRKILNATSIAFVPIEAWRRDDVRKAHHDQNSVGAPPGWYFNQWDMTELSIVGVPSNPNAVGLEKDLMGACRDVLDREKSFMSMKLQKAWQPYCATAKGSWSGWCPTPAAKPDLRLGTLEIQPTDVWKLSQNKAYYSQEPAEVLPKSEELRWDVYVDGKFWTAEVSQEKEWVLELARWKLKDVTPRPEIEVKGPYQLTDVPPPERWNKSLSNAFDVEAAEPDAVSSAVTYRVAGQFLGCQIKDLYSNSVMVPSPRMGSFLSGLKATLAPCKVLETRNFGESCSGQQKESPPVFETLQLNSKSRDSFLVQGTMFLEGLLPVKRGQPSQVRKAHKGSGPHNHGGLKSSGLRFVLKFEPQWSGLQVTVLSKSTDADVSRSILDSAWAWANKHNFLRGEAFALSGDFLQRTGEGWDDVFLEEKNKRSVQRVLDLFNRQGKEFANRGMILTGPPGTGKTLSSRIVRNQAKGTFIWVSARDFHSAGSVGGIGLAFEMAKELAPSVLCFEDVDNWLHSTTVDLLKTEMDGIARSKGVLTVLTTNFPERLPDALIDRPGRFHDVLEFGLPTKAARGGMLRKWLPLVSSKAIDGALAETDGYSGAHVYELAKFAETLIGSDGYAPDKALGEALIKVKEQRELITRLQLEGSHYNPLREMGSMKTVKSCEKAVGDRCECGAKIPSGATECESCRYHRGDADAEERADAERRADGENRSRPSTKATADESSSIINALLTDEQLRAWLKDRGEDPAGMTRQEMLDLLMKRTKASGAYFVERRSDGWYAVLHDEGEELGPYRTRGEARDAAEKFKGLVHTQERGVSEDREAFVKSRFDDVVLRRIVREETTVEGALERAKRQVRTGSWSDPRMSGGALYTDRLVPLIREAYSKYPEKAVKKAKFGIYAVQRVLMDAGVGEGYVETDAQGDSVVVDDWASEDVKRRVVAALQGKFDVRDTGNRLIVTANKSIRRKAALSQSDGRTGGYTVPPGTQSEGWIACRSCGGDGNCGVCGGEGVSSDADCPECGGSGECGACAGEGHVEKSVRKASVSELNRAYDRGVKDQQEGKPRTANPYHDLTGSPEWRDGWDDSAVGSPGRRRPTKSLKQKQLDPPAEEQSPQLSTPQVLAALYSHAKAEAAYLDQLDDQYKDSLADYRKQQVEERMDMLKYQFSRAAGEDDDLEKMCKDFEDEHDKGMESTGPDQTVEPGEAGLVEQGQIPPEEEELQPTEKRRKGRTVKQNTAPAEDDSEVAPFDKAAPGTDEWAEEEATEPEHKVGDEENVEEKQGGVCMCGMEVPEGAVECPGCGAPTEKVDLPMEDEGLEKQDELPVEGELPVETMAVEDEEVVPKDSDPSTEEILERYQHPKSKKWATRKWLVSKALLPFLKHRVAANGRKYLVRAKQVEEPIDDSEVKSLTTKLAGAIDDLKALYKAPGVPKHLKPGLKHVADQIWYVGKALTDKGKEQRNGGGGSELSDKGKEQRDGGKGSELKDKGEQQGKTPTKSHKQRQVSLAVEQKLNETMAKLKRFGALNGAV